MDYLGLVLVRPLPQAVTGRCVLRTYDGDGGVHPQPQTIRDAMARARKDEGAHKNGTMGKRLLKLNRID